jgi:hypothetical protein
MGAQAVSENEELITGDWIKAAVLRAYGLREWDISSAPAPLHVRLWRAVTFAKRRGKVIDWRSYERAEAEYRAADEAYRAAIPGRMEEVAALLSEALPDGLRFEWGPSTQVAAAVSVAEEMGIDPAVPMTAAEHAEFVLRLDERRACGE